MRTNALLAAAALAAAITAAAPGAARAKIDLVTLPEREKVQITIYNEADLTLARDTRALTMRRGANRLQFAWSGTLIDPTSLDLVPLAQAGKISVLSLEYPPRVQGLGIWNIEAAGAGTVPFEITYFTSGISWQAYYLATLSPTGDRMRLEGYVRVHNRSGEDYEDAETRLVVGKVNLLDRVADLARRREPHGRPGQAVPMPAAGAPMAEDRLEAVGAAKRAVVALASRPKEIVKEGLSEYFLYSIEGTEDIADGWGTRLASFAAAEVPVRNLFRYEQERYGDRPVRFVSFANDEAHRLGKEPIPGGLVKVFRRAGEGGSLSYVGARETKYVPKGGEVDLNLGPSELVGTELTPMAFSTDNYEWDHESIVGWDEHWTWRVKAANFRDVAARLEIRRSFPVTSWELETAGEHGAYERVDADTVQYTLDLPPNARREFTYTVTLHMGSRGRR